MKLITMLTIACVIFVIINVGSINGSLQRICKIPNGDGGKCVLLQECTPLLDIHTNPYRSTRELQYLLQSAGACGSQGRRHKVCCPPMYQWHTLNINPVHYPASDIYIAHPDLENPDVTTTAHTIDNQPHGVDTSRKIDSIPSTIEINNNLETSTRTTRLNFNEENAELIECGVQTSGTRIVGGSVAEIDEYPWLALLEYEPDLLLCGGSLITDRFVLTAAHCLTTINGPPARVRLSEYNLTTGPTDLVEMDGGGFEEITVTIIPVELAIPHPNNVDNDIGLIKMKERVQFSDFIRPICLPTRDLRSEFTTATKFIVAGWGSDNVYANIPVKMDVLVPYVSPPDECATSPKVVQGRYICAGGEAGKDSCSGDSGGPLMLDADVFTAVGVVSRGQLYCGTEGAAAEYTYVYAYLEWIYSTMEANK